MSGKSLKPSSSQVSQPPPSYTIFVKDIGDGLNSEDSQLLRDMFKLPAYGAGGLLHTAYCDGKAEIITSTAEVVESKMLQAKKTWSAYVSKGGNSPNFSIGMHRNEKFTP